jgi:hypothetical protein
MSLPASLVPWLPAAAVALHLVEEFAWPGGFGDWYRAYRPDRAPGITARYLVRINAVFVALALLAGALGSRPYGVALWLVVASVGAANAVFHVNATWTMRRYSPGVVTGVLCYVPLALYGFPRFFYAGEADPFVVLQAAAAGPLFHLYSAWRHGRASHA